MRVKSSTEIAQMKKYSGDLSVSSKSALAEARKDADSVVHLLARTPMTRHDMKDALKYAKLIVGSLREALRDSGKSERMARKALKAEKTAKKALLRQEKQQIAQMKKAEPAVLRETVVKAENVETKTAKAETVTVPSSSEVVPAVPSGKEIIVESVSVDQQDE